MKKYILWVTTQHKDGGYSSRWHGWSRDLRLNEAEALKEKARIEDKFYAVELKEV